MTALGSVLAFLVAFILYSQAYHYLWMAKILNIMPGYWFAALASLGLVASFTSIGGQLRPGDLSGRDRRANRLALGVWAVALGVIALFSYLFSVRSPEQLRALKTIFICIAMFGIYLVVYGRPRENRVARTAILLVVLMSVLNNLIDVAGVYLFSVAEGRGAGFYGNPNISAVYLVMGMIVTASLVPPRYRLWYCFLVGVGVIATFSRSGLLLWLVSVYGLGREQLFRLSKTALNVMVASIVALVIFMQVGENLVTGLGLDKYLSENATQRLHLDLDRDDSLQGRMEVARRSLELIQESPWVGHGLGAHNLLKTRVAPHNMYLLIGVELGILGVALYLFLLVTLWRVKSPVARVFAVALGVWSLFDHNIVDHNGLWLAYAVLAGYALAPKPARSSVQKAGEEGEGESGREGAEAVGSTMGKQHGKTGKGSRFKPVVWT